MYLTFAQILMQFFLPPELTLDSNCSAPLSGPPLPRFLFWTPEPPLRPLSYSEGSRCSFATTASLDDARSLPRALRLEGRPPFSRRILEFARSLPGAFCLGALCLGGSPSFGCCARTPDEAGCDSACRCWQNCASDNCDSETRGTIS